MHDPRGRIVAGLLVVGLTVVTGTALAQDDGAEATDERVVFTIGDDNDIDSMNPAVGQESPAYFMFLLNYDLLVQYSLDDLSPAPGLAESWEVSGDELTWTFHIREGAEWSDGEPITAHDVAFTYRRTLDDPIGNWKSYLTLVERIEVVDDYTLEITTRKPTTSLLTAYIYILPEHVFKDIDAKELKTYENYPDPVTSGPFRVVEWQRGEFFRMEANPDYWAGAPKVDEIVYRVFNNEDALVQALRNGEVDFADTLGAPFFDSLRGADGIALHESDTPSNDDIGFNTGADETIPDADGHPALKDPVVRRAISMAIDREMLVERILNGHGTPGTTLVPPLLAFYHHEPEDQTLTTFDLDAANEMLDDAGYEDTDGDGVREMPGGGRPLEFRYYVRSEQNATVTTSQFVTEWLADIGIATDVKPLTDTRLFDLITSGDYDMFHWGWGHDPDPDFILSVLTCGQRPPEGTWNETFYCNREYDRLYERQKTALDLDERAEIIKEMQQIAYDDAPYAILYYDKGLQAYSTDWTGFRPQPAEDGDLIANTSPLSLIDVRPVSATERRSAARESTGALPAAWIAVAAVIVIVVGILLVRSRSSREDRA